MKWVGGIGRVIATIARYALALGMMPYGISKLFQAQFQVFASQYSTELGTLSGNTLTWAFLGRSPWFQVLLGVTEIIPSALLLFRRTKTIGAVLMVPPALGVCLVNFALQLWPETRFISATLLALNVVVLLGEWPAIKGALRALLGAPVEKTRLRKIELAFGIVMLVGGVVGYTALLKGQIGTQTSSIADFIGDRQINGAGAWSVQSVMIGDESVPATGTRVLFDFDRHCVVEPVSDEERERIERRRDARRQCTYVADRSKRTFELHSGTSGGPLDEMQGKYEATGDRLTLTGTRDGKNVRIVLQPWSWEAKPTGSAASTR
jgi:hypothetical protein